MAGVFELELTDRNNPSADDFSDMEDDDEYVDVADVSFSKVQHKLLIIFRVKSQPHLHPHPMCSCTT